MGYDQAYARGYLSWILRYPNLHSAIETCLGPEVLGNGFLRRLEGEDAEERQLAARIVNGINCAPYDQAYARGYLSWLLRIQISTPPSKPAWVRRYSGTD